MKYYLIQVNSEQEYQKVLLELKYYLSLKNETKLSYDRLLNTYKAPHKDQYMYLYFYFNNDTFVIDYYRGDRLTNQNYVYLDKDQLSEILNISFKCYLKRSILSNF